MTTQSITKAEHTATEETSAAVESAPTVPSTCVDVSALLSSAREARNQFDSQVHEQGEKLPRNYLDD